MGALVGVVLYDDVILLLWLRKCNTKLESRSILVLLHRMMDRTSVV
jgi:hypothetical protein